MLCMLDVGKAIPPELYQIVAAIYVQLLKTSDSIKNGMAGLGGMSGPRGREGGGR